MQLFGKKEHLNNRDQLSDPDVVADLVRRSAKGDQRAQKTIYDALAPKMMAVCLRYMGDRESAEDTLQDGFVTLFTKLDSYSGDGSFEGWARKIFVNTALMSLRKKDVMKQTEDVDTAWNITNDEPSAIDRIGYRDLVNMIASLPPGFRTVFNMYVVEGFTHKEIAEALGISENTSRSQLLRARAMLQEKIKKR